MDGFSTYPFFIFEGWNDYTPTFDKRRSTIVGNDVWFGTNVAIMPGVTIGDGAIIGAYAVVTKDVPLYSIVAGNPSREVKHPEYLLDILMINFEKYFSRWKEQGFSKIRQYWLKNAYKLGEMVSINDGNIKISGIFKDIDENGSIRIQLDDGKIVTSLSSEILNFLPIDNPTSYCEKA